MTPSDVTLLRSLVEWRRDNGWTREYRPWDTDQHDHTYEHKDSGLSVEVTWHRIELFPGEPKAVYEVGVEQSGHLLFHGWPWSVRSAVNSIAATEVIPPEMAPMHSSAFAAGRESAGRLIEADTETRFESQIWWSDGETEEFSHFGPDPDMLRERVIGSARDEIGEGNDVATVVRSEARSFDVRTYRVNEQVLARFGDWVRVPEVGGTSA